MTLPGGIHVASKGKGWFPIFRFYGPLQPLYEKTWKLPDIEPAP